MSRQGRIQRRSERRSRSRRVAIAGGALAVVLAAASVAAFALGGEEEVAKRSRRPAPTSTSTTTTTVPIPTAPLTGLPDPQGVTASRAALAVKIENTPEARPQSGLDVADVVYEEVVEGGITRLWAIFNSGAPDSIGPIRSVRAMDPGIISSYGGIVTYSGGTESNVALIRALPVVWVDENNAGDAFFREPTRPAPHDLYGRSALLFQRGGQPAPPRPHFLYVEPGESFAGESIASFHLNFRSGYDVTYQWNAVAAAWGRLQRTSEPFLATGSSPAPRQVTPQNVIVQFVPYNGAGEGNLFGTGEAWIFSNGQLVRGTWAKLYASAPTAFYDAQGQPIHLTPGRTWVELLPTGSAVDLVAGPPVTTTTTTSTTTAKRKAPTS